MSRAVPRHMTKRRMTKANIQRALASVSPEDEIIGEELLTIAAMEQYARTGKVPKNFADWRLRPQASYLWIERLAMRAMVVQFRLLDDGMRPDAPSSDKAIAAGISKNALDRTLGTPATRIVSMGKVIVEFGGLNPDAFPQAPKASQTQIVEIAINAGTEIPGEEGSDGPAD